MDLNEHEYDIRRVPRRRLCEDGMNMNRICSKSQGGDSARTGGL
jgi:hypothetical protein